MARYGLTFMQVSINFMRTMPVVDTLMRRERLPFSTLDLLHIYTKVKALQFYVLCPFSLWKMHFDC